MVVVAARTRVHRRDEHRPRGVFRLRADADDADKAILQRLAQGFQRAPVVLRQLVEEQHARLAVLSVHESFPPKVSLDEPFCQYSQQFYPFLDESTLHEFFLRKTVFLLEQKEHSTGLQKIQCTK